MLLNIKEKEGILAHTEWVGWSFATVAVVGKWDRSTENQDSGRNISGILEV